MSSVVEVSSVLKSRAGRARAVGATLLVLLLGRGGDAGAQEPASEPGAPPAAAPPPVTPAPMPTPTPPLVPPPPPVSPATEDAPLTPPPSEPLVELPSSPEPVYAQHPAIVTITDHGGAAITSRDGAYELRIRAVVQTDLRLFVDDEHKLTDQFLFRRARPYLEGKIARAITFRIMPDFAGGQTILYDAWFDVRAADWLRFRVGKAKAPFGLERLVNDTAITMGERSFATTLSPNRDLGVELHGDVLGGMLGYSIGVYNGVVDNGFSDGDQDDSKEVVARLEAGPFARSGIKALRGLRLGVAATRGEKTGTAASPYLTGYKTFGQNTFFSFLQDTSATPVATGTTVAAGLHARETAQLYWPIGPLALLGELVVTDERVARAGVSKLLTNTAWNGTASFVVTGEDATFDGPTPAHPLDLDRGHFGAVELAFRLTELHVDSNSYPQFADESKSARDAFEVSGGVNWYPIPQLKFVADFARTTFHQGATPKAGFARDAEDVFLLRTQLAF